MNDCEKYTELMSLMLDGELSAEQTSELRAHIASCENCRKVFDAFTSVSEALSEDLAEPPEMLAKGVMFKIRNHKKHRFSYGKFTAIAACLALILLGAAKYGFFGGESTSMSLDNALTESETYGGCDSSVEAAGAGDAQSNVKFTKEEIQKGVKLKKTDDGTVYQLGFPIQNVQLLEGAKLAEVQKEPVWLLNAETLEVYRGRLYTDEELQKQNDSRTTVKNDSLASVTDSDTLDRLGALLTSVPDDTTKLTVNSREFTDSDPVYTIFIPAREQETSPSPSSEVRGGTERTADSDEKTDSKPNTLRDSFANVKNSLLNRTDSESPSPSPSAKDDEAEKKAGPPRDMTISVYYVDGEIWCVAELVKPADTASPSPDDQTAADERSSQKPQTSDQQNLKIPAMSASPEPSASSASPSPDANGGESCRLLCGRILYKAAGTPEKLDALMKKLADAGDVLLTENSARPTKK